MNSESGLFADADELPVAIAIDNLELLCMEGCFRAELELNKVFFLKVYNQILIIFLQSVEYVGINDDS